jgi:hypothetical protein
MSANRSSLESNNIYFTKACDHLFKDRGRTDAGVERLLKAQLCEIGVSRTPLDGCERNYPPLLGEEVAAVLTVFRSLWAPPIANRFVPPA